MVNSGEVSSKVQILLFTLAVQCPYRVSTDLGLLHRGIPPKSRRQEIKNFNFFIFFFFLISNFFLFFIFKGKLHFTTLNYPLDYTLHPKLSDCTLCTLNYHTYHALHPDVIFLLYLTESCCMWQTHTSYLGETKLKDWNTLLKIN